MPCPEDRSSDGDGAPTSVPVGDTEGRLKAGMRLLSMPAKRLADVYRYQAQHGVETEVAELLALLDGCERPDEYYDFQRDLFSRIYEVEQHRRSCSRALKRVSKGGSPQIDAPDLGDAGRPTADSWRFEIVMAERVARQLRVVGDALVWRVLRYNRAAVLALSSNDSPGLMAGKTGLDWELGAIEEVMHQRGNFAILHGITNCLRIGDITEIDPASGEFTIREVKANRKRLRPEQMLRTQAAIDAVMAGGPLPGQAESGIFRASTRYRANHKPVREALSMVSERGAVTLSPGTGRVLHVAALPPLLRQHEDVEAAMRAVDHGRAAGLKRAGIDRASHLINARTGDGAGRSTRAAPYSIFPLSARDRAALICDSVVLETVVSVDYLIGVLRDRGLHARSGLQPRDGDLDPNVLHVSNGDVQMTVHPNSLVGILYESLEPAAWADAVVEVMRSPAPPRHPEIVLSDEEATWRARSKRRSAT